MFVCVSCLLGFSLDVAQLVVSAACAYKKHEDTVPYRIIPYDIDFRDAQGGHSAEPGGKTVTGNR